MEFHKFAARLLSLSIYYQFNKFQLHSVIVSKSLHTAIIEIMQGTIPLKPIIKMGASCFNKYL